MARSTCQGGDPRLTAVASLKHFGVRIRVIRRACDPRLTAVASLKQLNGDEDYRPLYQVIHG